MVRHFDETLSITRNTVRFRKHGNTAGPPANTMSGIRISMVSFFGTLQCTKWQVFIILVVGVLSIITYNEVSLPGLL
jgi:hypothetical protein